MQDTPIIVNTSILINATLDEVWDAVTNPITVKKYFFGTDMVTDWSIGNPIYFRGTWEGKPYEDKGIVKTFVPGQSLSYTYKAGSDERPDVPENYYLVTYTVAQKDMGVELSISQTSDDAEKAKHSEGNWNMLLGEIKKLLETK
ncbi:MAG: SRPBCC family protein [Patescibacteria group bacterium]